MRKYKVRLRYLNYTSVLKKSQAKVSQQNAYSDHIHCENKFALLPVDALISDTVSDKDGHPIVAVKTHAEVQCKIILQDQGYQGSQSIKLRCSQTRSNSFAPR